MVSGERAMRPGQRVAAWVFAAVFVVAGCVAGAMLALDIRPVVVRDGEPSATTLALVQQAPSAGLQVGDTVVVGEARDQRAMQVTGVDATVSPAVVELDGRTTPVAESVRRAGIRIPVGSVAAALQGPAGAIVLALLVLSPLLLTARLMREPRTA